MAFILAVVLFRALVSVIVYGLFKLLNKDTSSTVLPNSVVAGIVAGSFGYLCYLFAGNMVCYQVQHDSMSNFIKTLEYLFTGSAIGTAGLSLLYLFIIAPYLLVKSKYEKVFNLEYSMRLFIPLSLQMLSGVSIVILYLYFIRCYIGDTSHVVG